MTERVSAPRALPAETPEREAEYFLALDQGGHASRALLFDRRGRRVATAERDIATHRPRERWVEHDPGELASTLLEAANEVLRELPESVSVRAGLATQRSSLVCWDRESGEALTPVISWQDLRGQEILDAVAPPGSALRRSIYEETGLAVSGHYGASKYAWCLRRLPEVARAARDGRLACGPLASYLAYAIVAGRPFVADPANGARTQLCSFDTGRWSARLFELFGLPAGAFPPIVPNRHAFGELRVERPGVALDLLTGDQSAALFAFGEPVVGRVSVNAGTGAFLQAEATHGRVDGLLTAIVHESADERRSSLEGSVNGCAAALHAVAADLGVSNADLHAGLDRWAGEIEDLPLFVNGVSGLASPFWAPDLASEFVELRSEHGVEAKLVAVLESIVFLLAENLLAIERVGQRVSEIVLTGGLAGVPSFGERLASLTRRPVLKPPAREATARGIAWLLGCAELGELPAEAERLDPEPSSALDERFARWRRVLRDRLGAGAPPL